MHVSAWLLKWAVLEIETKYQRELQEFDFHLPLTFSLVAVSGSMSNLISLVSWLTLGPTTPAPVRITRLLGDADVFDAVWLLRAAACVRFFTLLLAIAWSGFEILIVEIPSCCFRPKFSWKTYSNLPNKISEKATVSIRSFANSSYVAVRNTRCMHLKRLYGVVGIQPHILVSAPRLLYIARPGLQTSFS